MIHPVRLFYIDLLKLYPFGLWMKYTDCFSVIHGFLQARWKVHLKKMSKHAAQPLNLNTIPRPEILEGLLILPPPRPHLSPFNSPTFFRHFFFNPVLWFLPLLPSPIALLFHQPLFPSTLIFRFRVKVVIINYHIQKISVMKYTCKESSPASQSSYPSLSCSLFLQPL